MLILERREYRGKNEIVVGDEDVVITILAIIGNRVKIGITTKDVDVSIHRREIFEQLGLRGKGGKKSF
jgi:carbon storage regulator CsrA